MRALDRLPRRGKSRPVHPLLGLLVALSIGIFVSTSLSSVASADPSPGTTGPYAEIVPGAGRAADPFVVSYWYIDPTGLPCQYATADLSWDGTVARTVKLDTSNTDPVSCKFVFSFPAAPSAQVSSHTVSLTACYVDATGSRVCDPGTTLDSFYDVQPTPTLVVAPASGLKTAPFKATYNSGDGSCSTSSTVQFSWDGVVITPDVPMGANCVATMNFANAPSPNKVGSHTVSAVKCIDGCVSPNSRAAANYAITAPRHPTPTPTPTPAGLPQADADADADTDPGADPTADGHADPDPDRGDPPGPRPPPTPTASPSPKPGADRRGPWRDEPAADTVTGAGHRRRHPDLLAPGRQRLRPGDRERDRWPDGGPIDPAVVTTNILLTLLVVFFFGLTAEIFNSTLDANREEVHGWWSRIFGRPLSVLGVGGGGASADSRGRIGPAPSSGPSSCSA